MAEGIDLTLEIKEAIEIDGTNILEELRRHSAKYFYYGVLWARAAKNQRKVHTRVKALEATLMKVARTENPKISSEMKTEFLNSSEEYTVAMQEEIQATYMEEVLSVAKDAMRQRGNALQELARQNRTEEWYGDEYKRMKGEFDERVKESPRRRKKIGASIELLNKEQEVKE
jgi:hypothetical protein